MEQHFLMMVLSIAITTSTLTILALLHYNLTQVECIAYFDDSPTMHTDVVDLTIIQGVED